MKRIFNSPLPRLFRPLAAVVFLLLFVITPVILNAQNDTTVKQEEPAVAEESTLISPSVEFMAVQKADNSIDLKAALKAKVNKDFVKLYRMKLTFFQVVNEEDLELGHVITDGNGKAVFNVKGDSLKTDAEGKLHFKVVFAGNKAMDPAEELVSFKRARLEITPVKEDSLLSVQVSLVDMGTGTAVPVKDATVGIFVKRQFLPLKVGEGTTDETGAASIEFPNNLPGDAKGNLTVIGRLDENELYGNLEASVVQPWGKPVSDQLQKLPRALWSTSPPIWMLITFVVLMATVWGHYIVIIFELFRLRKEEPKAPSDATNV